MRMGVGILVVTGIAASALWAQPPAFEVASVKPNHTGGYPRTYPRLQNGTFTAEIASLKTLIVVAYGLIELRINGPDWLDTEKYDIIAKAPEGVPDSQIMPLLQSLLKDRFHLENHFETKEMPAYDMVVSKGGAKLKPFDPAHPPEPPRNRGQAVMMGVGTTTQIADALARAAGRPVVDKTGMAEEGRFGWTVNYTPFSANDSSASAAPDLFAAIEQQLGLKLESRKESVQILVIDHVERVPSEN
jgi:bla regulator protein BlaR1